MAETADGRMALLRVRVTERVLSDLDSLASTWDTTRSEALRRAVREAAERVGRFGR
jgi:metal-responsive CopG/Arc/MetJ family transcriptional regulator